MTTAPIIRYIIPIFEERTQKGKRKRDAELEDTDTNDRVGGDGILVPIWDAVLSASLVCKVWHHLLNQVATTFFGRSTSIEILLN